MERIKPMTLRRKMSFLARVDRISKSIQTFNSGQEYIAESDWRQLRNMEDVIRYGSAGLGGPSVHNLVRLDYIEKVRTIVESWTPPHPIC